MNILLTEHLLLRPLVLTDLDDLAALYAQPAIMHFITGVSLTADQTAAGLKHHINNHAHYGFGMCAILLRDNGQLIGRGGLSPVVTVEGIIGEVAWLLDRPYWGMGFATEVGRACITTGFTDLRLPRIFARAYTANMASIRIMQKLAMRKAWETAEEVEYELLSP